MKNRTDGFTKVPVVVTFLRMDSQPKSYYPPLPSDYRLEIVKPIELDFYRHLYNSIGQDYLWWVERVKSDSEVSTRISDEHLYVYVLYCNTEVAGLAEINTTHPVAVNINYFGLMPAFLGKKIGFSFLRHVIDIAWAKAYERKSTVVTLNTNTGDHPNALPLYIRAGFRPVKEDRQVWPIPNHLNMKIPSHLEILN